MNDHECMLSLHDFMSPELHHNVPSSFWGSTEKIQEAFVRAPSPAPATEWKGRAAEWTGELHQAVYACSSSVQSFKHLTRRWVLWICPTIIVGVGAILAEEPMTLRVYLRACLLDPIRYLCVPLLIWWWPGITSSIFTCASRTFLFPV